LRSSIGERKLGYAARKGRIAERICERRNEKDPVLGSGILSSTALDASLVGRTTMCMAASRCSALPAGRQDVVSVVAAGKSVDVVGRLGEAWTKRVDETLQTQEQLLVACICRG
jgi:hypothetical protein